MALHSSNRVCWRRTPVAMLSAVCLTGLLCGTGVAERKAKPAKTKPVKESRRAETRDIESLEEQWRTAIVSGDAAFMEQLLADDFLAISARGTLLDKEQYVNRISTHATKLSSMDLMDLKIRVQPGSAVAVSQARINGMLEGRPIEGVFRYTKVYTRTPGGTWHMTNFEATRVSRAAAQVDADQSMPYGERPTGAGRSAPPASDR